MSNETATHSLFNQGADQYAIARPQYPAQLFEHLFELSPDLETAWDCATGSGQAAVALAKRFGRVEATDVSAAQIEHAFAHERVRYGVQQAEQTDFADASFSLVAVAQALHWFDLDRFWPEVHRVLKPGGAFAAWGYGWPRVNAEIDRVVQVGLLDAIAPFWAPNNQLLWNGYRDITFPFEEISLPPMAISQSWSCQQFLDYLKTWSATRRYIEKNGADLLSDFENKLHTIWGNETYRIVNMDISSRVGYKP